MTSGISGPPEIGLLCSYVPRELIEAAGYRPRSLRGLEEVREDPSLPDTLCPYVRRCASFLAGEGSSKMAALVITDSCYPMLRLGDYLGAGSSSPVILLLRVPRKKTPEAVAFFRRELESLSARLSDLGNRPLDAAGLRTAVAACNRSRRLQSRVAEQMLSTPMRGIAPRFAALMEEEHLMPREDFNRRLDELLDVDGNGDGREEGPRLLVAGSYFLNARLLALVEGMGAVVAALDSCSFGRAGGEVRTSEGDILGNLAAAYLHQPPCPRMHHSGEAVNLMRRQAASRTFDGALYVLPRNCTPHAYHLPLWRSALRSEGLTVLTLETEDGDWSSPRSITRIEAFLESLEGAPRG